MLGFLKSFIESYRREKERNCARRRRRAQYARPGMDDFQLQQRIVPATTTRFEWIGGTPAGPTDFDNLNNWKDLVTTAAPTNYMGTGSYLQFDASATANCVVGGVHSAVGEVSILKAGDAAGIFRFTIEIPANKGLAINNNMTTEKDYYGNANTSDFGSGTIQVDGGSTAGAGGTLFVGGGRLNWNGGFGITVDNISLYKGQFVLSNSVTAYIQGPDGGTRNCSAHIYDGYTISLTSSSPA